MHQRRSLPGAFVVILTASLLAAGCLSPNGGPDGPSALRSDAPQGDDGGARSDGEGAGDRGRDPAGNASGDAGAPATPAGANTTDAPGPALVQAGCTTLFGGFWIPASEAAPYLPEGFEFASRDPAGAAVYGALKAWRCTNTTLRGAPLGEVSTAVLYFSVDAPDRYARSDVDCDYVLAHTVTNSADVAALFDAWNFGTVHQGDVVVEGLPGADGAQHAGVATDAFSLDAGGAVGLPLESGDYLCRYFGVEDGAVTNAVDIPVSPSTRRAGEAVLAFEGAAPFGTPGGPTPLSRQDWPTDVVAYTWENVALG